MALTIDAGTRHFKNKTPSLAVSPRPAGKHANINKNLLLMPFPTHYHNLISLLRSKGVKPGYAGQVFSRALFRSSYLLPVNRFNTTRPARVKLHAYCALAGQNDAGKANRQAIRRRKSHTDGENHDDFLYTSRTSAPNTAAATSVSSLEQSGSSKRNFLKPERIFIRPLPTASLQRWKPV